MVSYALLSLWGPPTRATPPTGPPTRAQWRSAGAEATSKALGWAGLWLGSWALRLPAGFGLLAGLGFGLVSAWISA